MLSDLSAPRRQRLHSEVAGAIERLYGDRMEDRSSELAHHYSAAGNAPKAVEYHLGNIYGKFGLKGRQQLRRFLGESRQLTPA